MESDPKNLTSAPSPDAGQEGLTAHEVDPEKARGNMFALEIVFLSVVAIVVVAAFLEALTYKLVSSRTPFVIMVPLLALIAIHGFRLWRVRGEFSPRERITDAFTGKSQAFNRVLGISGWMVGMVLMILVMGHYAGILAFCAVLTRFLAKESWLVAIVTSVGTTLFIWGVFEFIFDIDLYRGLVIRYFQGFRDF